MDIIEIGKEEIPIQTRICLLESKIANALKSANITYYIIPEDEKDRHRWRYNISTGYVHRRHVYGEMRGKDVVHEMLRDVYVNTNLKSIEFCVQSTDDAPGFIVFFNANCML